MSHTTAAAIRQRPIAAVPPKVPHRFQLLRLPMCAAAKSAVAAKCLDALAIFTVHYPIARGI